MKDMTGARGLAELDRLRSGPSVRRWADCDLVLMALMTVLCLIGLVMVLSASSVESLRQHGSPWYYFERQALWLFLGAVAFIVTLKVDHHRWRRLGKVAVIATMALMVVVLVPGVGVNGGGSARWIGIGPWRVQPSELAKLALVLFAADILDRRSGPASGLQGRPGPATGLQGRPGPATGLQGRPGPATGLQGAVGRGREWRFLMMPVLLVFCAMAVLVMAQPDMGTTMILACIVLATLYVAGSPLRPLTALVVLGGGASLLLARSSAYRWRRMTSFLHPLADAGNAGYQSAQGMVAMGSGRWFGLGLGATRAATGYLPNQYTDFIYAIIGEETGLLGSLLVVGLFVALAVVGIRVACRAPDRFGSILVAGITAWLVGQAVINIGAVVGLLPVTGVPLPFVSFGGSSLIIAMSALGICCNVAKQSLAPSAPGPQRRKRRPDSAVAAARPVGTRPPRSMELVGAASARSGGARSGGARVRRPFDGPLGA